MRNPIRLGMVGLLLAAGCSNPPNPSGTPSARPGTAAITPTNEGLSYTLTPGGNPDSGSSAVKRATPTPLSEPEVKELLQRLPGPKTEAGDRKAFALRPGSLGPPRSAKTNALPFPPPNQPAATPRPVETRELEVVSISPRGDVRMAPQVAITFNQPMVPLSTVEDLEKAKVPAKLTPDVEGKWRWLGSDTLLFVPKVRLPMATHFGVEVAAGTESANGQKLKQAFSQGFSTPPVQLESSYPGDGQPQRLRPLVFVGFDQEIDPQALAGKIVVKAGEVQVPFRQAKAAEAIQDDNVRGLSKRYGKTRSLVLVPQQALRPGTSYTVEVPSGTPSKEGPVPTKEVQSFSFRTYDPLKVVWKSDNVGYQANIASGLQNWTVSFNNALAPEQWKPEYLKVTPPIPGLQTQVQGEHLTVRGEMRPRTTYRVSLDARVADQFDQTLQKTEEFDIKVGAAEPWLKRIERSFVVLDPKGPRSFPCKVINMRKLRVRLWKVQPQDWAAFELYNQNFRSNPNDLVEPGQSVFDSVIATNAPEDVPHEVPIDLKKALNQDGLGQLVLRIDQQDPPPDSDGQRQRFVAWIQSTQIGLDAMADSQGMLAWANDLKTGKALPEVELQLLGQPQVARSDTQGLARLPLRPEMSPLLLARKGNDLAILPRDVSYWSATGWNALAGADQMFWHVLDDRHLYKPGEEVAIKGWLRNGGHGPKADVTLSASQKVSYEVTDTEGNSVAKGSAALGKLGGFDFRFKLPKNMNLGYAQVSLSADQGGSTSHSFEVQEFRRPEFEVSAQAAPGSAQIGQHTVLTTRAGYYSGGPLANAPVRWNVNASPTNYSPPGWDGYSFGSWTPWWDYRGWGQGDDQAQPDLSQTQETRSDGKGQSNLRVDFVAVSPPRPYTLSAEATVQDVNRQSWSSNTSVMVHPASVYVGLKSERTFVEKGQPLPLTVVVTDLDGKPVAGRAVRLRCVRQHWDGDKTVQQDEKIQQVQSTEKPLAVQFATRESGTYKVEALVQDGDNRSNSSDLTVWVAGAKPEPSTEVSQEAVTLIPNQKEYRPGDTAEVLVQCPFAPAEVLYTTRREGLDVAERVTFPSGSGTLKIPIAAQNPPSLWLQVDAVGSQPLEEKSKATRPAFASGLLALNVSSASRALKVDIKPVQANLSPGAHSQLDVQLQDAQGQPVQGEVVVIAVDEALLALSGYNPADPLPAFLPQRSPGVADSHLRAHLLLQEQDPQRVNTGASRGRQSRGVVAAPGFANPFEDGMEMQKEGAPQAMLAENEAPMASTAPMPKSSSSSTPPIKLRSNFAALALWAPRLQTDAQGKVRVPIDLPDNLTRYRLIALAAAGTQQFGKGESALTARQPLQLRPSVPRFLNFGDRFELPVVVENASDKPVQVKLACRASNARLQDRGYSLQVPASDRVEVRFPASTDSAGTARFQFAASAGKEADAAEVSLPVWTPATSEAFASYGTLDAGAVVQPVTRPKDVFDEFGGLSVTTSSTALAELTDAFLYLCNYPFECSEQVSSRVLATVALKDVLTAFDAPGLSNPKDIRAALERDVKRLHSLQNEDGGWDFWVRGEPSLPYLSVHVTHALVRTRSKGFAVSKELLDPALQYLTDIESHLDREWSESTRRSIRAYALYVLKLAGKPNASKARLLAAEVSADKLELEVIGWLLPTLAKDPLAAQLLRQLDNRVTQTASTAQFTTSYGDQGHLLLHSERRTDAILLEALIASRPKHPIIPKLVRGLLDHRKAGSWENTQENGWALLALDAYFQRYEKVTPDFVARVWLGDALASQQTFKGRSKDENQLDIPLAKLGAPLTLGKQGNGRLYYRLGLRYAPKDLKLAARDQGFSVQRNYEPLGDNRDVRRDKDGSWHIKAGTDVRVTVTMHTPSRRYHVALVDPLPAGLEPLNPALQGSGQAAQAKLPERADGWWSQYWYQHQNLRDERAEAFTQLLWEGVYSYSYTARATTPGEFVVPPARAEEMYHPETFGRSASDRVIVEE